MKKNNYYLEQYLNELTEKGFFDAIGDGISIQDTNFKILYQNNKHKSFIGEHIGKYCYRAYEKRKSECEGCPLSMTFKDGLIHTRERTAPIDGKISYFEITSSPLKDNSGAIIAGIEVVRDISERKKYERSVRESEERFRQLAENITEVFYISNLKTHNMLYISPGYEVLWGRSCKSLYSNPYSFIEAIHPDYRDNVQHSLERQLQGENTEEVYRIIRPDRSIRWIRDRAFPVKDASDNVYRVIGIAEDISEQKIYEEEIRERREHYHSLLDICPDAIVETGLDGKILFCNQQALKMHGYENPTDLIGQDSLQLMHEEDIHIAQTNAELLLNKGYFKNMTYRMKKKDGTSIPVEVSACLLKDDEGVPKSFIGYIKDITERKESYDALRRSEEQYRLLVESSNEVIFSKDREGRYHSLNLNAAIGLGGASIEDIIGKTDYDLLPKEQAASLRKVDQMVMSSGKTIETEEIVPNATGQERIYLSRKWPTYDDEGVIMGIGCIASDITERKNQQMELAERGRFIESLMNLSPDIIYIYDLVEKKNIYSNDGVQTVLGYSAAEVQKMGNDLIPRLMHSDDLKVYLDETIPSYSTVQDNEMISHEYRMQHKKGTWHWLESTELIYKRQPDGSPRQIFGVIHDITKRKKALEKVKESENKLSEAQQIAKLGHYVFDIKGDNWISSDELDDIFGIDKNYKRDTNGWLHIVHTDYKETMLNYLQESVLTKHQKFDKEYKIINFKNGQERWVHGLGSLKFNDSNSPIEMFGTIQDITERKQSEIERGHLHKELKKKNKELEQILYVASHDLRSPLVNIDGFSKELEYSLKECMSFLENETDLSKIKDKISILAKKDIPESLHYIQSSTVKMGTLIKGILTLSRMGRSKLTLNKINMNEMITDIIDNHRFRLDELKIKTEVSTLPDCTGDSLQINQLFSNLLDNAIKYSDSERSSVIKISGNRDNDQSIYCIEDNGVGIAPEYQEKIFEIFHQLEPLRVKGEGIGLTIAHRIIEKHEGKIWIESELGKGSKFFVSLHS